VPREFWVGFGLGWTIGAAVMWWWFVSNHLIRSRREWYADRRARGYRVPDDWEDN